MYWFLAVLVICNCSSSTYSIWLICIAALKLGALTQYRQRVAVIVTS